MGRAFVFMRRNDNSVPIYLQISLGLLAGIAWGLLTSLFGFVPASITIYYIKPIGEIFVNLLQMVAIPLVFVSLVIGIANLDNIKRLSRIGSKTIGIYLLTTFIAIVIGLGAVNLIQPGKSVSKETKEKLLMAYGESDDVESKVKAFEIIKSNNEKLGPLSPIVDAFPKNIFKAASDNTLMLQVVMIAMIFGVAVVKTGKEKSRSFISFCESLNNIILTVIDFIMKLAPYAVFALISTVVVEVQETDLLLALLKYVGTVLLGLGLLLFVVYPLMLLFLGKRNPFEVYKALRPAQLLAFGSSSSSAALPVTMKQCEREVGISEKVSSFVLPLGATINMDGTSLYQAIAAVFIAQVTLDVPLSIVEQITIVFMAMLASIGSAGVPGAGIVMLAIVLESVHIPVAYIALIMAPDRILDMCRTVVNVTGDATVATIVAASEGELKKAST